MRTEMNVPMFFVAICMGLSGVISAGESGSEITEATPFILTTGDGFEERTSARERATSALVAENAKRAKKNMDKSNDHDVIVTGFDLSESDQSDKSKLPSLPETGQTITEQIENQVTITPFEVTDGILGGANYDLKNALVELKLWNDRLVEKSYAARAVVEAWPVFCLRFKRQYIWGTAITILLTAACISTGYWRYGLRSVRRLRRRALAAQSKNVSAEGARQYTAEDLLRQLAELVIRIGPDNTLPTIPTREGLRKAKALLEKARLVDESDEAMKQRIGNYERLYAALTRRKFVGSRKAVAWAGVFCLVLAIFRYFGEYESLTSWILLAAINGVAYFIAARRMGQTTVLMRARKTLKTAGHGRGNAWPRMREIGGHIFSIGSLPVLWLVSLVWLCRNYVFHR